MTAQRSIVVVNHSAMLNDNLYRTMHFIRKDKLAAMKSAIETIVSERRDFEATRERRLADGSYVVGQSGDIKHVEALAKSDAFARLCVALKIDPRSYIYPQSQEFGKSSSETSNLKAYKKAKEVAEVIWNGSSTLERVAKVFTVCSYIAAERFGQDTLKRDFCENFLSSREFRSINQGSEDLWNAIDEVRARHMSTGASTQASQMVRTLVALKSAQDVRDGRAKDVRIDPQGLVMNALMRRFGQVTDVVEHDDAVDTIDYTEVNAVDEEVIDLLTE
jgi:hypothetical protein